MDEKKVEVTEKKTDGAGAPKPARLRGLARFRAADTKIVRHGRWFSILPLAIILAGILMVVILNFNLGLDFTGGRIIKVTGFSDYNACLAEVKSVLAEKGVDVGKSHFQREESTDSTGASVALTVKFPDPKIEAGAEEQFFLDLKTAIETRVEGPSVAVVTSSNISASASGEKMMNVFISVTAALIGILIYMLFRFKLTSGIAAIIALFHDVLVMAAMVAIFRIQINFVFVAAIITIIGYSLNNTLVLFDRVRDKERDPDSRKTTEQIVDESIKETLGRTINTTLTTLVPVLILAIFGVSLIREFALPIIFGLVAGTYSSIFLATALYVRFENARKRRKSEKAKEAG
jgi:preprotein translocase subunit SecF